jgi:hypothetical protein
VLGGGFEHGNPLYNPATGLNANVAGRSALAGAAVVGWYPDTGWQQRFSYWQLG